MCQSVGCGKGVLLTAKMFLGGMLLTLPSESAMSQDLPPRLLRKPVMRMPRQFQQNLVAAGNQNVAVTVVNGHRKLTANQTDKHIEIEDDNGQNIKMKVTETNEGKPVTKEYQAENLDALKKLSAEAAKLFEDLTKPAAPNPGAGFPAFGPPPGFVLPPMGLIPTEPRVSQAQKEIDSAIEQIDASRKKLKKLEGDKIDPKELDAILEELDQAKKTLFAAHAALK